MSLTDRFIELLHYNWADFVELEHDENTSSEDGLICGLIRACADGDMRSIKTAFARSDGEVEIPVQFKLPTMYIRYINAKEKEPGSKGIESGKPSVKEDKKFDMVSAKLRETLNEMRKAPKKVVALVLGMRTRVDDDWKKGKPLPPRESIPMVKSVIAANLLHLANYGNSSAVNEVFNQIDGKLVKVITVLNGEDVYVDNFVLETAPPHAFKDKDGVWVAEDKTMTNMWVRGFSKVVPQLVLEEEDEFDQIN